MKKGALLDVIIDLSEHASVIDGDRVAVTGTVIRLERMNERPRMA